MYEIGQKTTLKSLNLGHTQITGAGIRYLLNLHNLRYLTLTGCREVSFYPTVRISVDVLQEK